MVIEVVNGLWGSALGFLDRHVSAIVVLAVAALYAALMLVLPWRVLTRTWQRAVATALSLAGLTALGTATAAALREDPRFSLVAFVQSPVLVAAGATVAALLALFGALRSVDQQREAAADRETQESARQYQRVLADIDIAGVNAGFQWTSQFAAACRAVLDASEPAEVVTTLAIVDVLTDQAPNPDLGKWAEGVGEGLRAPARQALRGVVNLSGSGTLSATGFPGPPREPGGSDGDPGVADTEDGHPADTEDGHPAQGAAPWWQRWRHR